MRDVQRQLIEYLRSAIMKARNVASFSLRQVKRVLGTESKAEERELKRALDVLTYLGLLEAADGKKPRYVLRRGSPLWTALELGCVDLVTILVDGRRRVAT